jgi:uncharacterized membrane protein
VLPTLAIYALSFAFVSIYWINHHHLVHRTEEADQAILYTNLFFLFCLSLIPFVTSYLLEMDLDSLSVALYAVSMLITGFAFMLLRLAIGWRLRHKGTLNRQDQADESKHWISLVLYLISIPMAFYHSYLALSIIALVALVWIYPVATHPSDDDPSSLHP